MNHNIAKSNGFSLIEVLLAVFIFAVGLLGIAGLQIAAKQNAFDSEQRTTAALLASEIAEKIRINTASGSAYESSITNIPASSSSIPTIDCTNTAPCTSGTDIAKYDLKNWYNSILGQNKANSTTGAATGGLASPSACITAIKDSDGKTIGYDIAIAWRGKVSLSNPTANACGEDVSVYGTGNTYRRLLVFRIAV